MIDAFFVVLITVACMLMYGAPGYILIKTKLIAKEHIASFSKLLLYVCSPCLAVYSFQKCTFSWQLMAEIGIFLLLASLLQGAVMGLAYLAFRRRYSDVKYRIITIACAMGNCAFFGVPLLEAVLPQYPEAVLFTAVYSFSMNTIGWTISSSIISGEKKYCTPKKALINPTTCSLFVALFLFVFHIVLPDKVGNAVALVGRMSTPLSLIIAGMRFATIKPKKVFCSSVLYLPVFCKQILMPLLAFAVLFIIPIDANIKRTLYLICCCPVASVVLAYSEILGKGQEEAVSIVLLSTSLSLISVPIMNLL